MLKNNLDSIIFGCFFGFIVLCLIYIADQNYNKNISSDYIYKIECFSKDGRNIIISTKTKDEIEKEKLDQFYNVLKYDIVSYDHDKIDKNKIKNNIFKFYNENDTTYYDIVEIFVEVE